MKRTSINIQDLFKKHEFYTSPKDVFTVLSHSNMIGDSIGIHLENDRDNEDAYFSLENKFASWEFLKAINEMGDRTVLFQVNDTEPIPFENSKPYVHRFN